MSGQGGQDPTNDNDVQRIGVAAARRMTGDKSAALSEVPALSTMVAQAPHPAIMIGSELLEQKTSNEVIKNDVESLIRRLSNKPPSRYPDKQWVRGVFFAAHLLYPGWWTRSSNHIGLATGEWQGSEASVKNIRHWLNAGYEQWGPSWNLWNPEEKGQSLFGQIGSGDEANSLRVIIAPKAATKLLGDMGDNLAVAVTAHGTLYHDSHKLMSLGKNIKRALELPSDGDHKPASYYLVVSDFEEDRTASHDYIRLVRNQPTIYSAYMWHCLIRSSDEFQGRRGTVPLPGAIYTWEHTNLMDRDSVAFSYESLMFKKRYLEKKLGIRGGLKILQHSFAADDILRQKLDKPLVGPQRLVDVLHATHDALSVPTDRRPSAEIKPFRKRNPDVPPGVASC